MCSFLNNPKWNDSDFSSTYSASRDSNQFYAWIIWSADIRKNAYNDCSFIEFYKFMSINLFPLISNVSIRWPSRKLGFPPARISRIGEQEIYSDHGIISRMKSFWANVSHFENPLKINSFRLWIRLLWKWFDDVLLKIDDPSISVAKPKWWWNNNINHSTCFFESSDFHRLSLWLHEFLRVSWKCKYMASIFVL